MILYAPEKSLTWTKNIGLETYMSARAGMLMEIWDQTNNVLLERRWDKEGGVFGENNHPTGSELNITAGVILKVVIYNLSTNKLPMQCIVFNAETTNTNDYSTYPTGMVDGNGTVSGSSLKLHKKLIGGQKVEFQFIASTSAWWKINTLCMFEIGTAFSSTNPNDGTDYGASFFQLDYYGGNIRWANPNISNGDHTIFPNSTTWNTENSTSINPWYLSDVITNNPCSKLVNGLVLSTWNGAGAGGASSGVILNQPFALWDFGWGFYRAVKVIKYKGDGITPHWFEVRGKDAYKSFPYATGIDGTETSCTNFGGALIGLNVDTSVVVATGYDFDNGVFKTAGTVCATPSIGVVSTFGLGLVFGDKLELVANGSDITQYQWYKNNAIIGGATLSKYIKNNVTAEDSGLYFCKVFNNCGGVSTTSQKDSEVLNIAVSPGINLVIDSELQGECAGLIEYGYHATSSNIADVDRWFKAPVVTVRGEGTYRFFGRLVSNHAVFFVTVPINTTTIK